MWTFHRLYRKIKYQTGWKEENINMDSEPQKAGRCNWYLPKMLTNLVIIFTLLCLDSRLHTVFRLFWNHIIELTSPMSLAQIWFSGWSLSPDWLAFFVLSSGLTGFREISFVYFGMKTIQTSPSRYSDTGQMANDGILSPGFFPTHIHPCIQWGWNKYSNIWKLFFLSQT